MTLRRNNAGRGGVSLIEVAVSLLLVSLVLVAALNSAGGTARTTLEISTLLDGDLVAEELMAEVLAMPYCDPEENDPSGTFGIESDEPDPPPNRLAFDDLDDYDGWLEPSALADRDGAARMDSVGWGRTVEVQKINRSDPSDTLSDSAVDQGVRLVTVTATSPTGEVTTLQAIRSVEGANEQAPAMDMTVVTGVLIEITAGDASFSDAASLLNHASGP